MAKPIRFTDKNLATSAGLILELTRKTYFLQSRYEVSSPAIKPAPTESWSGTKKELAIFMDMLVAAARLFATKNNGN